MNQATIGGVVPVGVSMERKIALATPRPVGAGDNGPISHRLEAGGRLSDLIVDEGVEVLVVHAARTQIRPMEGQTWKEALAGKRVERGAFVTIIVHNTRDVDALLKVTLVVDEPMEVRSAGGRVAVPTGQPGYVRGPTTYGRPNPSERVGRAREPYMVARPTRPEPDNWRRRIIDAQNASARASALNAPTEAPPQESAGAPSPASPASPRVDPARVRPAAAAAAPARARVFTREVLRDRPTAIAIPNEGELSISLLTGHARALERLVRHRVKLPRAFRPAIARAITDATVRQSAALYGGSDTVVHLSPADAATLRVIALHGGGGGSPETRVRIADAIARGIDALARLATPRSVPAPIVVAPSAASVGIPLARLDVQTTEVAPASV